VGQFLAAMTADPEDALRRVQAEVQSAVPTDVRGADRDAFAADLSSILFELTRTPREGLWLVSADLPLWCYLGGAAKNLVSNGNRCARREGHVLWELGRSEVDASDGPADLAEREETRERVREALAELSPRLQEVVSGVLGGLSLRLIAHEAGLSEKTVDRRWASATTGPGLNAMFRGP
jgi:RNA polymerase sigma factor (sigma-70 family)